MLALAPLLLSLVPQAQSRSPQPPETSEERRAAVEREVTPRPWVQGGTFSLLERMRMLNVPGVSVAVLHEGKLDWAAGYGVRDAASGQPVTTDTVFQAASISKPVSSMVALSLAQEGKFAPDTPVNDLLRSWQLPEDGFEGAVTPRHIMSHTGGLGVHGFPGYRAADALPSVVQVLDGDGPANTGAVRRIEPLGRPMRYSGGGSTVLQLALCDLTGRDFTSLTADQVLGPLGMTRSTYAQPLPVERWPDHSAAHGGDGRVVAGRFHAYPEQYAAGLWTTPTDLLRFAREVQRGLANEEGRVLTSDWVARMLEPQSEQTTMGFFLSTFGDDLWFGHGGANAGFRCQLYGSFDGERGVAVMTNADDGSRLADEIIRGVARVYGWEGFVEPALTLEPAGRELASYCGRYAFGPDRVAIVTLEDEALWFHAPPTRPQRLVPLAPDGFLVLGSQARVEFAFQGDSVRTLTLRAGGRDVARPMDEFERWPVEDLVDGELELGLEFYAAVLADNPDDPMVAPDRLREQAEGHWGAGALEAGVALAALVTEHVPADPFGWELLGRMRASLGESEAAVTAFEACLEATAAQRSLGAGDRGWLESNARSMLRLLKR